MNVLKITLEEGLGYEIYQEAFDPGTVCVRLHNFGPDNPETPSFEVISNSLGTEVQVKIPLDLWEVLRNIRPKSLDLLSKIQENEDL